MVWYKATVVENPVSTADLKKEKKLSSLYVSVHNQNIKQMFIAR